jgi:asparagine synthase (glutamine-hydrolysing)
LTADRRGVVTRPYWRATEHVARRTSGAEWLARFGEAVRAQRVSDVPIGTLLSGGLDSSAVTAVLAQASSQPVETFTVSIPPSEGLDEAPWAGAVAKRWGCREHVVRVPAGDLLSRLHAAQAMHDEPLPHGNDMHLLELCRVAKQNVTVLLSGEGADETLGGYVRYLPMRFGGALGLAASRAALPLRWLLQKVPQARVRKLGKSLAVGDLSEVILYNAANVLPDDLAALGMPFRADFAVRRAILAEAAAVSADPLRQLMLYDLQTFLCSILDRNDRMTMAASIECRVPFLAVPVVEASLGLPRRALFRGGRGKRVLREAMADALPQSVRTRPKWGFGVPWSRYMREVPECRAVLERLAGGTLAEALGAPRVGQVVNDFMAGARDREGLIQGLFALGVWWDQVVEGKGQSVQRGAA